MAVVGYALLSLTIVRMVPGSHLARRCASSTRHGRADRLVRAAWPGLGGLSARRHRRPGSGASCHRLARASRHLDRPALGVPPWLERGSGRRLVRSKDRSGSGRLGTWRCGRATDQPSPFVGQTAERGRLSPGSSRESADSHAQPRVVLSAAGRWIGRRDSNPRHSAWEARRPCGLYERGRRGRKSIVMVLRRRHISTTVRKPWRS